MFGHDHFIKNNQKRIIKWDWFRISHDSKIIFVLCGYLVSFLFILEKKDNFILLCNIWSRVIIFSSSYFAMKGRARSFSPNNFKIITISRISREKLLLLLMLALSIYQSLYSFKKKKNSFMIFYVKTKKPQQQTAHNCVKWRKRHVILTAENMFGKKVEMVTRHSKQHGFIHMTIWAQGFWGVSRTRQ